MYNFLTQPEEETLSYTNTCFGFSGILKYRYILILIGFGIIPHVSTAVKV
jgi:hypothetical protein